MKNCLFLKYDYLGENVHSGTRYDCECNVLRDGGIRFIPTYGVLADSLIKRLT